MFKFHNPTNGRYYYIAIQQDMFDKYVLVVFRGGKFTPRAIKRTYGFKDKGSLDNAIQRLYRRRIARGYRLE